jgi:hypothetical protein
VLSLQVNKLVPATAVSGVVLGVKFVVYNAVPFTKRRFERYPVPSVTTSLAMPIYKILAVVKLVAKVPVPSATPFTNKVMVVPERTTATCVHVSNATVAEEATEGDPDPALPIKKFSLLVVPSAKENPELPATPFDTIGNTPVTVGYIHVSMVKSPVPIANAALSATRK